VADVCASIKRLRERQSRERIEVESDIDAADRAGDDSLVRRLFMREQTMIVRHGVEMFAATRRNRHG
jgi:hypothetical protein